MRVGLNLLHAMPEIGGGWNYIKRLIEGLGTYGQRNEYVAFVTDKSIEIVPRQNNIEVVKVAINPVCRPQRIVYENSILQMASRKYRLDIMHWFSNTISVFNKVPSVVTIYDLKVFDTPYSFSRMKRIYLRAMISHSVRHANILLPMSQTTASDIKRRLKARYKAIEVIPAIIGNQFKNTSQEKINELRIKYHLQEKYWLYVAHYYPHKNHLRLLRSYHQLKMNGIELWPLVLRGNNQGVEEEIHNTVKELKLEKDVRFLPRLKEEELPVLYSAAAALVFPSLYEGCGIPVIEAMACGCPVIAAKIPAVMEFAGEAAHYFDPKDINSIEEAITAFQCIDPKDRYQMIQKGLEKSLEYKAENVVNKLLNVYSRAKE